MASRVILVLLIASASVALIGLTATAGIAGFGFGMSLLIVGAIGLSVLGDVLDDFKGGSDA